MKSTVKKISALALIALLCLSLFCFAGCVSNPDLQEKTALNENQKTTEEFLNYVIDGNKSRAQLILGDSCTYAEFEEFYNVTREELEGVEDFELTLYSYDIYYSTDEFGNDLILCDVIYDMTVDGNQHYTIYSSSTGGMFGLSHVKIKDTNLFRTVSKLVFIPMNMALILYTIGIYVLTVFMIIDCAKRRIRLKPLWIVLLFAAITYSFSFGESFFAGGTIGLSLTDSSIDYEAITQSVSISVTVPAGLIVYFFVRKHLPLKPEKQNKQDAEQIAPEAVSEVEVVALPSPEESADEAVNETVEETVEETAEETTQE